MLVRKMNCLLAAGLLLGGTCLAKENAKAKELLGSKYYEKLSKERKEEQTSRRKPNRRNRLTVTSGR